MSVSKRTVLYLLLVLTLVSVALRYPMVEHERYQSDSYFIHLLSQSVIDNGRAIWTFNPLSYFGYYPTSYPSGSPFVLAELSILSGLDLSIVILISDMIIGILFGLAMFCLARQFTAETQYALFAAVLASLGSRFIDTTYWDGSARGPIIVLMVIMLFLFFRARASGRNALTALGVVLFVGCLAIHHMAILFLVFGLAYIAATVAVSYVMRQFSSQGRRVVVTYILALGIATILIAFTFFEFFGEEVFESYGTSGIFKIGPPILSAMLHMSASYTNQIGFILPVAVVGIPWLLLRARLKLESIFLVTASIFLIPVLGSGLYVSMVLSVFVSLLGVFAIRVFVQSSVGGRSKIIVIALLLVSSLLLPPWSMDRWNNVEQLSGDKVEMSSQIFNDGCYLKALDENAYSIANTHMLSVQLATIGHARFLDSGILGAINGDINASSVRSGIKWSDKSFPENMYSWYEYRETPYIAGMVQGLVIYGMQYNNQTRSMWQNIDDYLAAHSRLLVVVDNRWPGEYVDVYGVTEAKLPSELRNASWNSGSTSVGLSSYATYESEGVVMYLLELQG